MFDIGFSEILVIGVVALIVIGPERLPKVARTLGHLVGRMQRYVNEVKADIRREVELDELRALKGSVEDAARSIEDAARKEVKETELELQSIAQPLADAAQAAAPVPDAGVSAAPSPQLELGLDPGAKAPAQKQA
jgi:sec-independent protein translocase protein TatB